MSHNKDLLTYLILAAELATNPEMSERVRIYMYFTFSNSVHTYNVRHKKLYLSQDSSANDC